MPTSLKERGFFWLPGQTDQMVPGELSAAESGIKVELDAAFPGPVGVRKVSRRYPLLHGITRAGKKFSLFQCIQTGTGLSLHGPEREVLWIRFAIIGAQLSLDAKFDEMHGRLDHLRDWVARSGIAPTFDGRSYDLSYKRPEDLVAPIEGGEVCLRTVTDFSQEANHLEIKEEIWLIGRANSPTTISELADKFMFPLRELVSFATASAAVLEEVTLRTAAVTFGSMNRPVELQLFHQFLQPADVVRRAEAIFPPGMVFALADWPGDFESLVKGWLELKQRAAAALNIVFGLSFAPPRWMDTTVMAWAQAIETYHRHCFAAGAASQEALRRRERILNACPAADREWLALKLLHADEPSLVRRIKDVSRRSKPIIGDLLIKEKGFGLRLREARNAYAHFGAGTSETVTGLDLYRLSQTARWVLTANILRDLGFSEENAKTLIERNEEYHQLTYDAKSSVSFDGE